MHYAAHAHMHVVHKQVLEHTFAEDPSLELKDLAMEKSKLAPEVAASPEAASGYFQVKESSFSRRSTFSRTIFASHYSTCVTAGICER